MIDFFQYWIPKRINLRTFLGWCAGCYAVVIMLTVVAAHVAMVALPSSGWAPRLMLPIVQTLIFLDNHWKVAIVLVAPFFVPTGRELLKRLSKVNVGPVKIELEKVKVGKKPHKESQGRGE